jgi:aminoglycoside phosphotransferase (APT) family kinase protein
MTGMAGWLADRSVGEVARGLAALCPDLARLPVVLHDAWIEQENPLWARSSAFVGDDWVVKFAWSEPAAIKLEREILVLRALAAADRPPPVRKVHAWSADPVLLVSPFVVGSPAVGTAIDELHPDRLRHLAHELAGVLTACHHPTTLAAVARAGVALPPPTPQAETSALRARLAARLDEPRGSVVVQWCQWVDAVLSVPGPESVFLHGDFHGFNLVVDATMTVQVVLDLEEASVGDYHYDFRYLPAQTPNLDLFRLTVAAYEQLTQRSVALERVMAWHIRTVLGDALWRTEANVELPFGGTPEQWVDEIATRMVDLGIDSS